MQNLLFTALRKPRGACVQLPIFLVPFTCTAVSSNIPPRSRSYANHADLPGLAKTPRRDRSSYPRHPKQNFDPNAPQVVAAKKAKALRVREAQRLAAEAQELAQKKPKPEYGERGPDPSASRKHLQADFPLNTKQHNRDKNRKRGVSVIRSTGPRKPLVSISKYPLPVPVLDPARRKEFPGNPNHGLWQFFYQGKQAMQPPDEMGKHGREWTYAELALKSFNDLHALYWVCHKEANRVMTNSRERKRVHAGYGDYEDELRLETINKTCTTIAHVLRDRYESTAEAVAIIEGKTPLGEIDLDQNSEQLEDEEFSDVGSREEGFMEEKSQISPSTTRF